MATPCAGGDITAMMALGLLDEGIIGNANDGNIGSIMGIGFAPHSGRVYQSVNAYGLTAFTKHAQELADDYGERFTPPQCCWTTLDCLCRKANFFYKSGVMTVQIEIETKLANALPLQHIEVTNESNQHNVPPGSESHFKVVLVSDEFEPLREVARHQRIYKILSDEVSNKIHALALHTYTPVEWQARHGNAPMSPPCQGGSKHDKS